jgi:phenylalanine-4-hydroxylase
MRQLVQFLSRHAHPCYLDGLTKTGIEVDQIPRIEQMSERLEQFGWRAIPVSGFIPPAAFMELQSLSYLPIASDMRTIGHLMYTPAPDIVHEAAGHAPILIDPEFANYLKAYAQVARQAIISAADLRQYEAIRELSDLKEDPASTAAQVRAAEERLAQVSAEIKDVSEAGLLSRMNWWTAEYGLIGDLQSPRIYGAGLLSSVGEAKSCLDGRVKKIPLTLECLDFSYDITEPQPQLFVTPGFQQLHDVLEQLSRTMAFRVGGRVALGKALMAKSVTTTVLDSGLLLSGQLEEIVDWPSAPDAKLSVAYLRFTGPTQLSTLEAQILGQGRERHSHGFGTPLGPIAGQERELSNLSESDLSAMGWRRGARAELRFRSGVVVTGALKDWLRHGSKLILVTWTDATARLGDRVLFQPEWGEFDMAVGQEVVSVFGGPAHREAFGETDDFVTRWVPPKVYSQPVLAQHRVHDEIQRARRSEAGAWPARALAEVALSDAGGDWLADLDILELAAREGDAVTALAVRARLLSLASREPSVAQQIQDGLELLQ